jgi:glycosyltransferase involved in cell wall biosynthesis
MKASVIIPTHNREKILARVLTFYCRQVSPGDGFEVIVVDDGSTDGTENLFTGLKKAAIDSAGETARRYQGRILLVKKGSFKPAAESGSRGELNLLYVKLKKSGRSIARNVGIGFSNYPLIIFADDDIFVETDFVLKHISAHRLDDRFVVMGRVIHTDDIEDPLSARWKPKDINTAFLATGNASVLKSYIVDAGFFDENYQVYGWEDFDLGIHLEEMGLKSEKRRIYGYHYELPGRTYAPLQVYNKEKERGVSAVYFFRNHPLRWVRRFTLVYNKPLKMLFKLLGRKNWFLTKAQITSPLGIKLLIIRYKGYFDGIAEGMRMYGKATDER